ncbi:MAG: radical SAM protein [Gammaproteobacteria bacterium]|nr:radical SAM protein [Gammaproteobacteria bacterium]
MQRYNKIHDKIPREILLLKSLPCIYSGKCSFCNYVLDNTTNLDEIRQVNDNILNMITGEYGVVEIINSGSVFELPKFVLEAIRDKVNSLKIHTLYFEAYYGYHKRLEEMEIFFPNQEIRYRIGIETFDDEFRKRVLKKPFPTSNLEDLSKKFYACCLLICIKGQTRKQILNDIHIARTHFREITINVFVNNTTAILRDEALVEWFSHDVYPLIKDEKNIEILLDNKDQGVFVQ